MGDDRNNNKQARKEYASILRDLLSSQRHTRTVGSTILEPYLGISLENSIYSSILNAKANYATNVSCCVEHENRMQRQIWYLCVRIEGARMRLAAGW